MKPHNNLRQETEEETPESIFQVVGQLEAQTALFPDYKLRMCRDWREKSFQYIEG